MKKGHTKNKLNIKNKTEQTPLKPLGAKKTTRKKTIPKMKSYKKELQIALQAAKAAGDLQLSQQYKIHEVKLKDDNSPVSEVDYACAQLISSQLLKEFPDYGILHEESPKQDPRKIREYCWIVDPLDGTIEYINGRNQFGVLIGLIYKGKPILGAVYKPKSDEYIYAIKGQKAYSKIGKNKAQKIHVSKSNELEILISKSRLGKELQDILQKINPRAVYPLASSFKISEVAKGNATTFIGTESTVMGLWDLCAHSVILEEAGGQMTTLHGKPIDFMGNVINKKGIIVSNKQQHDYIVYCSQEYAHKQ